VIYFWLVKGSV